MPISTPNLFELVEECRRLVDENARLTQELAQLKGPQTMNQSLTPSQVDFLLARADIGELQETFPDTDWHAHAETRAEDLKAYWQAFQHLTPQATGSLFSPSPVADFNDDDDGA